ncbi:MAG TPA: amino acid adenylation domain-containing protein [Micromonosporaceae bacterium]
MTTSIPGRPDATDRTDVKRALREIRMRQKRAEKAELNRITPAPRRGDLPCTYQQRALWFLHQLDPTSATYQIPLALRLRGELDVAALRRAVTGLVARHEALRTRFGDADGTPYQVVDPAPEFFPLSISEPDGRSAREWVAAEAAAPMDLAHGPLFRVSLLRLAADDHVLLLVMHYIVADGWSTSVIMTELSALYRATRAGVAADLPELGVQPADYAVWQRRWLTSEDFGQQRDHWRETLRDLPSLEFPTDRPRPAQPTGAGALLTCRLPDELAAAARELSSQQRTSLLAVLLAAFLVVLHRYTGQSDLAVGSLFSGRTRPEIEPLVGYFANTPLLRTDLSGDPTARELIHRCDESVLAATEHQNVPFGLIVDALQPERVPGLNPLFQISFTLQPAAVNSDGFHLGGVSAEPIDSPGGYARFDLAAAVVDSPAGRLDLTLEYSTELFDRDRIERLAEHFTTALARIVADPGTRIRELDVLTDDERRRVLAEWNPPPVERAGPLLLHRIFTERAARAPDQTAMRFNGTDLSYRELDQRSNQLAHVLIEAGVSPGAMVAVLLERGFDLPVAELAILKTGAAWLPLDPQHPEERLHYQVADAGAVLAVTVAELATLLPAELAAISLDSNPLAGRPSAPPDVAVHPESPAYLIYTSGSTGRPKGVLMPHRAAAHFCHNLVELFRMVPTDRVLQLANPTFDVSVSDFFATFAAGATVVGAPREVLQNPDKLQALMREERITFGDIPPAVLRLLNPEPLTDIRVLFIGMEPFGPELVNRWQRPGREFHNGYGPTEATITCVDYRCPDQPLKGQPPIGRAMANHRAYVLDSRLRPTPIGVPGELYIAGVGLAHGYLGRPDLTAEKFLPDPFTERPGQRMYATGDLVRWRSDGELEFLGRADRQVKVRGLRIELSEIEHVLNGFPGSRHCAVVVRNPGAPDAHLVAYLVPEPDATVESDAVRHWLSERLPLHMVPSVFLNLTELPTTSNGKLDHTRLPDPRSPHATDHVAPRTPIERQLARIWGELLGAERVGGQDDFFHLGGNSLQATQLIARISSEFGVSLAPRELFLHPVLGRLAVQIDRAQKVPDQNPTHGGSPLMPINVAGTRPPLFFVHPIGGSVAPYMRLASLLDTDQPFYGLEDPSLHGGEPVSRVQDAAARYVAAVREVQERGPYYLGGWSFGGAVALEMAQRLRADGHQVPLVLALDTELPAEHSEPDEVELLSWFVRDVCGIAGVPVPALDLDAWRAMPSGGRVEAALAVLETEELVPADLREELRTRIRVFAANWRAFYDYRPDPYDGALALLSASEEPNGDWDRWRALCGALDHRMVPGNHYTMLQPPHLPVLAKTLRVFLDQTLGGAR